MLDYDDAGRIRLSGEAPAGAAVRIYVDNQPAAAAVAGPGGRWDAVLEQALTPGSYMLRLDQLGASGKPTRGSKRRLPRSASRWSQATCRSTA